MFKKTIYCFIVSIFIATSAVADISINLRKKTPINSAVRSFLCPGWGQIFNGHEKKGHYIFSGFVLSSAFSYINYENSKKTYEEYQKLGLMDDYLYTRYEGQYNTAAVSSYFVAALWLYAVIDAYLNGDIVNKEAIKKSFLMPDKSGGVKLVFIREF